MNKYNQPAKFDFLPHYRGNGLSPFILQLKYKNGSPVDLTGSHIRMDMKRYMMGVGWQFNSDGTGDAILNIIDPINGKIQFPQIKSWGLAQGKYDYDLFICDSDGFARAYMRGVWRVNQNISKVPCSGVSGGSASSYTRVQATNYDTETIEINGQTYEVEVILIEVDYQERGENGHTPYVVDGNWWINGVDTGKPSTGEDGRSAFEVWNEDNGGNNSIQDYFDYLRQPALYASAIALDSAQLANNSASNANTATDNANQATTDAQQATQQAEEATQNANTATNNAVQATTDATQATSDTIDAIANAEQATINANNARGWTPTSEFEEYNSKQIKKLTGYIGGTGSEPTGFVGQYFTANGFTSDKDLATDFKGDKGEKGDPVSAMIYVRDDYNQLPEPRNPNTLYFISKDA